MAREAIPIIAYPWVRTIYIYNYVCMFVSFAQVCIVYVVKEVTSFMGLSQLMGMVRKGTRAQATDQQEQCKC